MITVVILVASTLPARPRPRPEDLEAADLEKETVEGESAPP